MTAYYTQLDKTETDGIVTARFIPNEPAQGAWNPHEQHMAPASGLLARELEQFSPRDDMRIGRISFDIFGLITFGEFTITTQVIRPGRTIELVESLMQAEGKTCISARAWRMAIDDTSSIHGIEDDKVLHPEDYPEWTGIKKWPGGYIKSIEARRDNNSRAGKGIVWLNNPLAMVEGMPTSDLAHLIGMVDTANGIVPRQEGNFSWAFPNLDLQVHMHRLPEGQWLGLETTQQYGTDAVGLTSSILHDVHGPFGRSEQILTLRKMN
ncbi:MAG TPA: thioesterase [Idiomarina baltica]|uniref:Thioesterase n=1 Tax=Idiomarina baltica TaxID=190892 RepID=A0A348WL29_9GAMM|nr:thioesterase family protein [Alteromonas macleodii]MAD10366.1 thioesterase [Alteromonas sp.]HAI70794.1 thioesterase [Alteromonas australica]HAR55241.1 thioesterase [Idiomarina baltica]|tara:strand:- start:6934 stop:7731 length:798 start_codon:yes stop_codon:yes gene_type:complete